MCAVVVFEVERVIKKFWSVGGGVRKASFLEKSGGARRRTARPALEGLVVNRPFRFPCQLHGRHGRPLIARALSILCCQPALCPCFPLFLAPVLLRVVLPSTANSPLKPPVCVCVWCSSFTPTALTLRQRLPVAVPSAPGRWQFSLRAVPSLLGNQGCVVVAAAACGAWLRFEGTKGADLRGGGGRKLHLQEFFSPMRLQIPNLWKKWAQNMLKMRQSVGVTFSVLSGGGHTGSSDVL